MEKLIQRYWLPRRLPQVDAVVTDSLASQRDLSHYLGISGPMIHVIPLAASGHCRPAALARIAAYVEQGRVDRGPNDLMVNARQAGLLRSALGAMERVLASAEGSHSMDLVASDIRDALTALSDITGDTVTEDVLNRIFADFRIGK